MSSLPLTRRSSSLVAALAACAGAFALSACDSSSDDDTGTVAVAVSPASLSVAQGGSGSAALTITRGAPFTGSVALSQTGAPAGITVTFNPGTVAAGATTSTVDVAVAGTLATGNYPITIRATGTDVSAATTTLTVVVVAGPTLAVAVNPTTLNVAPGGTGSAALTITRGGTFSGPVTLSQSGAPAGVTVTPTPSTLGVGSTASTINVAVAGTVAVGSYPIAISAAGTGVTTATTNLNLVVVAGGAGSIALSASPTTLTAAVGAAAVTSTITIARTAPFTGPVALAVTGAPAGVQAAVNPASVTGTTATLTVTSTAGAVNGTYPLTVRGSGTGISDATTIVNVTVTGGSAGAIALSASPTTLTAAVGAAAVTSTITVARTAPFTGPVALAVTGAPAGVTATVNPASVTGTTATLSVTSTAGAVNGTYPLTIRGSGTGVSDATIIVNVTVTGGSGGGGGGNVSITFCAEDAPIWVASQDGSGAWARVTATSGTTYQFAFPSGRGGVAFVDTVGAGTDLIVTYGTLAEFTASSSTINFGGCSSSKTLNGSVSGVGPTEIANVNLGGSSAFVIPAVSTSFVLNNVAAGLQDLVATRADATFAVNWIILRRALNLASGSTLPVLAFGTEGFAPASANVTVTGLGADTAFVASVFTGVRGSTFAFLSLIEDYTAASGARPFGAVPAGNLQANEVQQLLAISSEQNNAKSSRTAGLYFSSVSNRTVALGPKLNTPTVTKVVTAPNARPNVLLVSQAQYNRLIGADFTQSSNNRSASVTATAAYFSGLPGTWNITLPDLSGAAGWNSNWGLADGTPIDWSVTADGGAISFLDATIADGSVTQSATIESAAPPTLRGLRSEGGDRFALQRRLLEVLAAGNRSPMR
jgi:uncharacterized membrane protein